LQHDLDVPADAAGRIVSSLMHAGIVKQVRDGVWCRVAFFLSTSP
jgi:hypothetical protein